MVPPSYHPGLVAYLRGLWRTLRWLLVWQTMPASECPPSQTALVVLDPIQAYEGLLDRATQARLVELIRWAQRRQMPIVLTRWTRTRPSAPADEIDVKGHWSFYVPEGQTDVLDAVLWAASGAVEEGAHNVQTVVQTRFTNAYANPQVADALRNCTHVVLAGCWLESCVLNTARAALDRNVRVTVVRSCCGGHALARHHALVTLQAMYATVVDAINDGA